MILSGVIIALISFLIMPRVVMNYSPGSLPREYDLYFPGCLNHSLRDYMKAIETSLTYQIFLCQHRDAHLTHFQIVSYNDSTVSPLILLSCLSSDGTSITYSTKPFSNDFIVRIDKGKVNSREQLSGQDIQKKIKTIAQVKFQTLFQKFVSAYEGQIHTQLGGETKVPDPDGLSIGLSVDYFSGEIRFRISAFSRVCGSLFTGQIDSTGNVTGFIVFYP